MKTFRSVLRSPWRFVCCLGLVAACGGKTEGLGPLATGGSSSGGTSTGGTGGVGAVGAVAGLGGGGPGGTGAVGGISTGGFSGGGTGGTTSFDDKAQAFCKKASTLPCGPNNCLSELYQAFDALQGTGCLGAFESVLDCAIQQPLSCSQGDIALAPACGPLLDKFSFCVGGPDECSVSAGPGSCRMDCSSWGGECQQNGNTLVCSCVYGPNAGVASKFMGTCNSPNWNSQLQSLCN